MNNDINKNTKFVYLQNQISRKLKAKTFLEKSILSSADSVHITTKEKIPSVIHTLRELNTKLEAEDFYALMTPGIQNALMCSENFEALIYDTFIPRLESEENPAVDLPDDLITLL
ncbi:hypothetical protein FOB58_004164 [Candida parapsilosis]|uniref:Uncharacterized protein n=2 Tax=Candida parapsilosis TaxID=5480 RepID=G8BJT4_CANPC|nr:uncharacterized protein CPAR2_407020 [Candida parapsilosis]KAF6045727.1 hypothetical protein FOB58_004164 [Candida parapsilosis]KAF6046720.1 hypothetical protein FOB59_004185 [Candida parapsilosis]KAF6050839.1 hypothetical protein FOB60_003507 [Candida parapsilosis]KAF6062439.1 hypothetical protein FOB61_003869 [Candida parapsilosis]KAI5905074.1 hypothetical protein K4G60_g4332 [Candida parapsilosis]